MIIVKLQGGLGNQLFQYATARALAQWHGSSVTFDLSSLQKTSSALSHTSRAFELAAFGIQPVQPPLLDRLALGMQRIPYRNQVKKLVRGWRDITEYQESDTMAYEPFLTEKTTANTYLVGYFQSERYFKTIENTVRQELNFVHQIPKSETELSNIQNKVSLHIRRGDYVTNPQANQLHGLCSLEYYHRAAAYLASRLGSAHFVIFSDDQAWVRENLLLPYPVTFVEGNQGWNSYKDMQLMSQCHHHIIANSSFSWWGAWLNPSPDKIVIAPDRWLAQEEKASESADRTPVGWLRM